MSDQNKQIELPDFITVRDLAETMGASSIDVIKKLMANGVMASINQQIDFDTAAIVAEELGFDAKSTADADAEPVSSGDLPEWRKIIDQVDESKLKRRPPVVTILGHVDHGKTSLLDRIRSTNVADGEAGGITQHIGAYQVTHDGRLITFLDTPGHAAFTAMRARGAQVTDLAILVVAADDGVMPQTKEAIAHAKAAQVPIVVALNKIDKANANPELVKTQLATAGLVPEEYEGDTMVIPISALKGDGIEDILEAILLVTDELKIDADPNGKAAGTIVEAERNKSRGVLATMLVQNGNLKQGDAIVAGNISGRVRAIFDFRGKKIKSAGPSTPVEIMGLSDVPSSGDMFEIVKNERTARKVAEERSIAAKASANAKKSGPTLDQIFSQFNAGKVQELNLIIKADVQGSLEPIISSLEKLGNDDIKVRIIHSGTGNIGESDILLASASDAIVIGFNAEPDTSAKNAAATEKVQIRFYNIIYRLIEDIELALNGMLEPEFIERATGVAEVRALFRISKVGNVAGCMITDGEIGRADHARISRGGEIIHEGKISSIKHLQEDVASIRKGFECGISMEKFNKFKEGDIISAYVVEEKNTVF